MSLYLCYEPCNNVILTAQQRGKIAALCNLISEFEQLYAVCQACIDAANSSTFITEFINQFYTTTLEFCVDPLNTTSSSASSACPPYPTVPSSLSNIPPLFITTAISPNKTYPSGFWLNYTFSPCPTRKTNPDFTYPATCLSSSSNLTWGCPPGYICSTTTAALTGDMSSSLPPSTLSSSIGYVVTDVTMYSPLPLNPGYYNLHPVIFGADWGIFTGEASITLSSSAGGGVATTTYDNTLPSETSTPIPTPPPQASSHVWIVDPVLGSLAGVAALLAIFMYFLRRGRSKSAEEKALQNKPQLDGQEVKPKEIAGQEIGELDSRHLEPLEMDTGYAGAELNTTRVTNIRRKPVP